MLTGLASTAARQSWPAILVLALGVAASLAAGGLLRAREVRQQAAALQAEVTIEAQALQDHLQHLVMAVEVVTQFHAASETVTDADFARFVHPLLERHPSLLALNWLPRVTDAERADFEAAARAAGLADFVIHDWSERSGPPRPAPPRPDYFPVRQLASLNRTIDHRGALGFDAGAEPRRRAALDRAAATGQPTVSPPLRLIQAPQGPPTLIVFAALRSDAPPVPRGFAAGLVQPGAALDGIAASLPIRGLDRVLRAAEPAGADGILAVRPSRRRPPDAILDPEALERDPRGAEERLTIADRTLILRGVPLPDAWPLSFLPQALTGLGLLFSLTLALGLHHRRRGLLALRAERALLEERVAERTAALQRSEAKLRTIFELLPVGISITDPGGHVIDCNPAAETILDLARDAHLARDFDGPEWRILRPDGTPMPPDEYASVRALAEQRTVRDVEMGIVTPTGEVRWILASAMPAPHPEYGAIITFVDIGARRRAEENLRLLQAIVEASDAAIAISDPDGTLVYINPAHERLFGRTLEQARGVNYRDYYPPESVAIIDREVAPALARGESWEGELDVFDCEGRRFPLWELAGTIRDARGRISHAFGFMRDVTERRQAELVLRDTLAELGRHHAHMTALNEMNHLLLGCDRLDAVGGIVARAAERLFDAVCPGMLAILEDGADPAQLRTIAVWGPAGRLPAAFPLVQCQALRRGDAHEVTDTAAGAQCRHFERSPTSGYLCLPLIEHDRTVGLLHLGAPALQTQRQRQEWRMLAIAVSETASLALANLELRERLRALALRDALTGLFNRRHLEETLPRLFARARYRHEPLAVAMLDVDHFKRFNDTHGHEAGDAVLRALGGLLRNWARVDDLACRYGGEELTLVLPGCREAAARARLEALRAAVRTLRVATHRRALPEITVSIGLAVGTESDPHWQSLLARADAALYRAKADGRNRVVAAPSALESCPDA